MLVFDSIIAEVHPDRLTVTFVLAVIRGVYDGMICECVTHWITLK